MIKKINKNADRQIRHARVRKKIFGTSVKPRLCVYRSTNYIYGKTLCSSSSLALKISGKSKTEASKEVGADIAAKALKLGLSEVVFDRGGYIYTGRVAALADGAREAGLKF